MPGLKPSAAEELDEVAVRIVDVELQGAGGALVGSGDYLDSKCFYMSGSAGSVVDLKGQVLALGRIVADEFSLAGFAGIFSLQGDVDLCVTRLEPESGEGKVRPWQLFHPEKIAIEGTGFFEVTGYDQEMVDPLYADWFFSRHVKLSADPACLQLLNQLHLQQQRLQLAEGPEHRSPLQKQRRLKKQQRLLLVA